MNRITRPMWLLGVALFLVGCPAEVVEAPPAPGMPGGWEVTADKAITPDAIEPVSRKLGAPIAALRNTVYKVNGKRVQLNTIVAPDNQSARAIVSRLEAMKSARFTLRKELVIYEFVGEDDATPMILAGKKHLQKSAGSAAP